MERKIKINFVDILGCEFYKIIRNKKMMLALLVPVFLTALVFVYIGYKYPEYTQLKTVEYSSNPFVTSIYVLFKCYQYTFPFIIAVICAQYFLIDKHGGWRLFDTVPYSKIKLLIIRYSVLALMVTGSVVLSYSVFIAGIKLCELWLPLMTFAKYEMWMPLACFFLKLLLLAYCIVFIQYGLHHISRNVLFPLIFVLIMVMNADFSSNYTDYYSPYGYLSDIYSEFADDTNTFNLGKILTKLIVPMGIFISSLLPPLRRRALFI